MEAKYKKFLEFNFAENQDYQIYYTNLYPTPSLQSIPRFKKRWYKNNIDKDFDINYEPPSAKAEPPPQSTQSQQASSTSPPFANRSDAAPPPRRTGRRRRRLSFGAKVQFLFLYGYLLSAPYFHIDPTYHSYSILAPVFAFLIGLIGRNGLIKFNMDYWRRILMDEDFHNLSYCFMIFLGGIGTVMIKIPLLMLCGVFVSSCFSIMGLQLCGLIPYLQKKKPNILEVKADIEVFVGFYLLVSIFFGHTSFILPLFYWQVLQMRYLLFGDTAAAFARLGRNIDWLKAHPYCPSIFGFFLGKLRDLGNYLSQMNTQQQADPNQPQQSGRSCNIF